MIIGLLGLVVSGLVLNAWFYEFRVIKGSGQPKEINLTGYRGLR